MADHPEIAAAKQRLREMVPGAIDALGELVESEHAGIRLSAATQILDRGGVPAKAQVNVTVDLTLDEEIEQLLRGLKRNQDRDQLKADLEIEDAEVVEDAVEIGPGEPVFQTDGVLPGTQLVPTPPEPPDPLDDAFWQAQPE